MTDVIGIPSLAKTIPVLKDKNILSKAIKTITEMCNDGKYAEMFRERKIERIDEDVITQITLWNDLKI